MLGCVDLFVVDTALVRHTADALAQVIALGRMVVDLKRTTHVHTTKECDGHSNCTASMHAACSIGDLADHTVAFNAEALQFGDVGELARLEHSHVRRAPIRAINSVAQA